MQGVAEMKNVGEIKRSIKLMTAYPSTFGYADFADKDNSCSGRLDRMTPLENIDYAESYAAVLVAMPKYSELHKQFAPVLAKELGLKQWPRYDYMVKLLARILGDDSQMMLNLQTMREELGKECQGRAWVIVTSQQDVLVYKPRSEIYERQRQNCTYINGFSKYLIADGGT